MPAVAALHAAAQQRAADMNPQGVSNTLLALARLRSPVDAALQAALLLAIKRRIAAVDACANTQHVANTLWSLSQLQWQRAATVSEALLGAAQRVAGSFSAQEMASSLLSLAALQWPLHASAAEALARSASRWLSQMNSQQVANVLWAQAWFAISKAGTLQLEDFALFARAAELACKLTTEERSQVRTAIWWPAALDYAADCVRDRSVRFKQALCVSFVSKHASVRAQER